MVSTIEEVNIMEAYIYETGLSKIRLSSSNKTGFSNWQDAIFVWVDFDPNNPNKTGDNTPQPNYTNQDFIDWENDRLNAETTKNTLATSINNELSAFQFSLSDYEVAIRVQSRLVSAFINGNNPSLTVVYQEFYNEIVGSSLTTPITQFITMTTGESNFATSISDTSKRTILNSALQFLVIYQTAYEANNGQ